MDKLLKFLFLIALFVGLTLGDIARVSFSSGVAVSLLDICTSAAVLVFILEILIKRKAIKSKLIKPIIFFNIASFLSLVANVHTFGLHDILIAALYLLRWDLYALLYFLIIEFDISFKKKLSYLFILEGAVLIIVGLVQYIFYTNLRNLYYLGWDPHLYRLFGSFLDPNFMGAFLVLFSFFVLGMGMTLYKKSKNSSLAMFFLLLLSFLTVILTYSRSAYAMLVIGLILFYLLFFRNKKLFLGTITFLVFAVIVVLFLGKKSEGTNLLRITSSRARIISVNEVLTIISSNPIFGVGFDAYRYAQNTHGFLGRQNWQISHAGAGTDNSFLFTMATTGILGFFAYVYLWIQILKLIYNEGKKKSSVFIFAIFSSFTALLFDSLFINSLFYPAIMFWFWSVLALVIDYK